jgi:hypothetical protein
LIEVRRGRSSRHKGEVNQFKGAPDPCQHATVLILLVEIRVGDCNHRRPFHEEISKLKGCGCSVALLHVTIFGGVNLNETNDHGVIS